MGIEGDKSDMVSQDHNIMQHECDILAKHFASMWDYASHTSLSVSTATLNWIFMLFLLILLKLLTPLITVNCFMF